MPSTSINDRDARDLLQLHFAEMTSRYFDHAATDEETDAAMVEDSHRDERRQ